MKTFDIYEHPVKGLKAVKSGWSWPGFFFGLFWLLYKTMWLAASIVSGIILVLAFVVPVEPQYDIIFNLMGLVIAGVLGGGGNKMYVDLLIKRGFSFRQRLEAGNPSRALADYHDGHSSDTPSGGGTRDVAQLLEESDSSEEKDSHRRSETGTSKRRDGDSGKLEA